MLRQLNLSNFKCFDKHTVTFERSTVLVGKNNAGKSTIVEALHLVAAVVNRKAASFGPPPRWADLPRFQLGIAPSVAHLDFDLRKVFHRYGEPPAVVTASFEGGTRVTVYLGPEDRAYATVESRRDWIRTSGKFTALRIPWIYILPQVAPIPEKGSTQELVSIRVFTGFLLAWLWGRGRPSEGVGRALTSVFAPLLVFFVAILVLDAFRPVGFFHERESRFARGRGCAPGRRLSHFATCPTRQAHRTPTFRVSTQNAYPSFHERLTLAWIAAAPFLYSHLTDRKPAQASAIPTQAHRPNTSMKGKTGT
jgi:hypothetical protein